MKMYKEPDREQKTKKAMLALKSGVRVKASCEKISAAKINKFFIHCYGRRDFMISKNTILIIPGIMSFNF